MHKSLLLAFIYVRNKDRPCIFCFKGTLNEGWALTLFWRGATLGWGAKVGLGARIVREGRNLSTPPLQKLFAHPYCHCLFLIPLKHSTCFLLSTYFILQQNKIKKLSSIQSISKPRPVCVVLSGGLRILLV